MLTTKRDMFIIPLIKLKIRQFKMFTRLKVWWMFRCFKKGLTTNPKMIELRKRMEASGAISEDMEKLK